MESTKKGQLIGNTNTCTLTHTLSKTIFELSSSSSFLTLLSLSLSCSFIFVLSTTLNDFHIDPFLIRFIHVEDKCAPRRRRRLRTDWRRERNTNISGGQDLSSSSGRRLLLIRSLIDTDCHKLLDIFFSHPPRLLCLLVPGLLIASSRLLWIDAILTTQCARVFFVCCSGKAHF